MTPAEVRARVTPKATRLYVAEAYAVLLQENWGCLGDIDVSGLNHAIIDRWSMSGLQWVKERAWKIAQQQ